MKEKNSKKVAPKPQWERFRLVQFCSIVEHCDIFGTTLDFKVLNMHRKIENVNSETFLTISCVNENKTRTSKVGAISKAQKAQKNFFGKKHEFLKKKFLSKKVA